MNRSVSRILYDGHTSWISALAWSPDGTSVASGSEDNTVQVWNSTTGEQIFIYRGHTAGIHALAWSPDGTTIASGGRDNAIHVWHPFTERQPFIYSGHTSWIRRGLAWAPHSNAIASGSWDSTVHIWNPLTGETLIKYLGHQGIVYTVAWSPDGRAIASGGGTPDNTVQIWDPTTGECTLVYRGHESSVHSVIWSPNGEQIVSGDLHNQAHRWNVSTGKLLMLSPYSHEIPLAWSPNWQIFITVESVTVKINFWGVGSNTLISNYSVPHRYKINALTWSPDGKRIAFGGYDRIVEVWTIEQKVLLNE